MPQDFQAQSDQSEQNLQDLINQQTTGLPANLSKYSANATGIRNNLQTDFNPLMSNILGTAGLKNTGSGTQTGNELLDQALQKSLGGIKFNDLQNSQNLNFQNQMRKLGTAQQNLTTQRQNAGQNALQSNQNAFQAAENNKDWQFQLAQNDLSNIFGNQDQSIQQLYNYGQPTQSDTYNLALNKAFGSLLGSTASPLIYRGIYGTGNTTSGPDMFQTNPGMNVSGNGTDLYSQSGLTPTNFSSYGR